MVDRRGSALRAVVAVDQGLAMPPTHRPHLTAARVAEVFGTRPATVSDVLALGVTEGQLRAAVRAGRLERVRHGVVAVAPSTESQRTADPTPEEQRLRHRELVAAALAAMGPESLASHGSAALLAGLPTLTPGRLPRLPVVTVPSHGRIRTGIHARLGIVSHEDREIVDGLPCTSVARTALDVARFRPLHESLVVLDAAVARTGLDGIRSAFGRLAGTYGMKGLLEAMSLADPRAESPLESASRGCLYEARFPGAELQAWVTGADGRPYRVDFLWRERKVVGEADGWLKYSSIADLREEKRREDALRQAGFVVVRWTSDELWRRPDVVLSRLRTALVP